jgi:hypothetical protein
MTDTMTLPGLPGGPPLAPASAWQPEFVPLPAVTRPTVWQPEAIKLPARTPRPSIPLFDLTEEVCEAASVAEREAIVEDLAARGTLHLPFERIAVRFPMDQISSALNWRPVAEHAGRSDLSGIHCTFIVSGALELMNFFTTRKELTDEEREVNENDEDIKAEIVAGVTRKMRVVSPVEGIGSLWLFEGQHGPRLFDLNAHKDVPGVIADHAGMAGEALTILLASLACKNVVKDVRYNGQIGRGAHAIPVYANGGVTFISMTRVRPPPVSELTGEPGKAKKPHMRRGHEHTVVHGKGRTLRRVQWFAPCYVGYDPAFAPPQPHDYVVTP